MKYLINFPTETDTSSLGTDSSSSSSQLPAATLSPKSTPASTSTPGSPVLDLDAIKAALACQYTVEQIYRAIKNFFTISCESKLFADLMQF